MNKDRVMGAAKVLKGKFKLAVGNTLGDTKLQAEGEADHLKGKTREAAGRVMDGVRDATDPTDRSDRGWSAAIP